MSKFYGVSHGLKPGVYDTWEEAKAQIFGVPHSKCKGFKTYEEAYNFAYGYPPKLNQNPQSVPFQGQRLGKHRADSPLPDGPILKVSTRGQVLDHGTPSAVGGIGVFWAHRDKRNVLEKLPGPRQTIPRAELWAVMRALQSDDDPELPLYIYTISRYVVNCMTEWLPKWQANGWRTWKNKPVANQDLIKSVLSLLAARPGKVRFVVINHPRFFHAYQTAIRFATLAATNEHFH
ncbi:hypothetical protein IWQ62_004670 [Dispira parvispora]|uniref:ribonuclease H n=1 Tax=Dispira parvispora TaxID=1520584 RepID=A0A9W8E574_9FUNG|nr:hypothetical protein IWQ62_004670 [Dispira parvispora]